MERISLVLAWIACAGMISPIAAFGQQPQTQQVRIQDVAMHSGNFGGQVVDHQGNAIAGAAVVVGQQGTEIAKTVTNANGRFELSNLAGGVYHIAAADTISVCRVWSENTAPPVATDGLLMVSNSSVVRGQCNSCNNGGGYVSGAPMDGGYVVNGPINGGYVDGGIVDGGCATGACGGGYVDGGCCGAPVAGAGTGGGMLGLISNPWFVGAVVAAAIAIPLAVDDDDDDAS